MKTYPKNVYTHIPTKFVQEQKKSSKILNYGIACIFSGIATSLFILTGTYDKRINTNEFKVKSGNALKPIEAEKELHTIKSSLKNLYASAENTISKQKAEIYAERDVNGLNRFYNASYSNEQENLDKYNCSFPQNLEVKDCKKYQNEVNPLGLKTNNVLHETIKTPKSPFSFSKNLPAPPIKTIHKSAIRQVFRQTQPDDIGIIVAINNKVH